MTREEAIKYFKRHLDLYCVDGISREAEEMAIQALSQEPSRNMEEIAEVIKSDVDAETKCKMISNILTAKPHYFEVSQDPMREFTEEEAKAYSKTLDKMYKPMGFNLFDELCDEIDFVQPHKKIPVTLDLTSCLKAQAKKQAMPMSCDDCCYEPNSPFCEMYRKDICEKKEDQKLGKWIPNYYFYGIYDYTCSECEKHSKERSAFCPKCGAKMESEDADH